MPQKTTEANQNNQPFQLLIKVRILTGPKAKTSCLSSFKSNMQNILRNFSMRSSRIVSVTSALLFFFSALIITACSGSENKQNDDTSQKGRTLSYTKEVSFLNGESSVITSIDVAVADEANERNMGLMDVANLPADKGMLFIFEEQQPLSFWMANTPLSLDIFFINESMEIVRIHQNTQPFSDENLTSGEPARYVVETNAGFSLSHDIQEGMTVEFDL